MDLSPDEEEFPGRLLHQAALWDNVELVTSLLSSGAAASALDGAGRSALHAAAVAERSRCLLALCRAGAPLDAASDRRSGGKTALHLAAERGHAENVRTLLAAGASPLVLDANGDSPLALAERLSHRHAASALRDARELNATMPIRRSVSLRDNDKPPKERFVNMQGIKEAPARMQVDEEADAAFDVTDYFLDDLADPWRQGDAVERERLSQHSQLRELVVSGDVTQLSAKLRALGAEAGLIANLTPGGANTLLYVASEAGLTGAVSALLDAGADGRAHPVTKYGPLYIAAYHGHKDIVKLLLAHFPSAVQVETVERWLPLHAACIGGHAALVTLLLEYRYPDGLLQTYTDGRGEQYRFAFDVNARDVSEQTALYIACTLGNLPVVEALLRHSEPCLPPAARQVPSPPGSPQTPPGPPQSPPGPPKSPAARGISLGIHAIVSKLTGNHRRGAAPAAVCGARPVRTDVPRGADSCVACAARHNHVSVLRALLAAGADANAPAPAPQPSEPPPESRRRSRSASAARDSPAHARDTSRHDPAGAPWSALAEACRLRHVAAAELLLRHGATDPGGRALAQAAAAGLADLLAQILATKAYPDPDYKINKSLVSEQMFSRKPPDPALTYNSLCPTTPVMVNWRELKINSPTIRMRWLRLAAAHVNRALSRDSAGALHALTRLDVSNNELRLLPPQLFTLLSIRYINAAQNKLERLPSPGDPFEEDLEGKRGKKKVTRTCYTAPVLQEVYLQDNRLEALPPSLFSLPALTTLDVSNNKLQELPPQMWTAPCLRDLNAALNHLRDLPGGESEAECSSPVVSSPVSELGASPSARGFPFNTSARSTSRSPSVDSVHQVDDGDAVPVVANRNGNAVSAAAARAHAWRGALAAAGGPRGRSALHALNLAHNQLARVPPALACRAAGLARLNLAYNSLRSMSYVTSYPTSLRQLDLSHNEITCWPSLPQVENFGSIEDSPLACYCPSPAPAPAPGAAPGAAPGPAPVPAGRARPHSGGSVRSQLLNAACPARRHLRLEGLRTLILSNNLLTRIQLTTDDDGYTSTAAHDGSATDEDEDWASGSPLKGRLLFPLLSMLDVSCNMLRAVPPAIHALTNLSVLNISGNKDITSLPPQMGLLSRLWSLNAAGCSLQEPLRSMLQAGQYKSADIVGYLKSVLHAATRYTRMKLMFVGQQGIGKTSLLECLRQESAIQHRRKPTDHWARRMGNKSSRGNLSTVGVDIGTWVYEKPRSSRGPVTFRTWDFGGQHEYYATHQYFLSRRSLYLVLWRATDGKRGLAAALDWLRSIQARAPGSPVIMVATHYDQVANCNLPEWESPSALQRLIRSSIMGATDADKLGLPRVLDSLEVSCSTRHNMRLLADIIYSVAFSIKPPGSKEPLLEQRIPATYLALEECVTSLAAELPEPVLRHNEYKRLVTQYMQQKNLKMFRDAAELHQATMFLHENGVLLHYDDATLKELYFLRPQWLCDVLAHVVTVREINPFAANGVMRLEELSHVFKASPPLGGEEAGALGLSLLNKFELALCWDSRVLLVPALLPPAEPPAPQLMIRSRGWGAGGTPRRAWPSAHPHLAIPDAATETDPSTLNPAAGAGGVRLEARGGAPPLRRALLAAYVPRGFWPRLCARLLADPALAAAPARLYCPPETEAVDSISKTLELNWGWKLWKRGMKLVCGALTLVSLRELPPKYDPLLGAGGWDDYVERDLCVSKFRIRSEGGWCELDAAGSAAIDILLPAQIGVARRQGGLPLHGYQSISMEPNPEVLAQVLALVSDHVDLLLEDWYPSLGTRFVHTSEGRCLVTRVAPCPACLADAAGDLRREPRELLAQQAFRRLEMGAEPRPRLSEESRTSDGDSGVGPDSNTSSRLGSVEGVTPSSGGRVAHAWTVEQCILCACTGTPLHCPHHPDVTLRDVAPDALLLDVEEEKRARWEHITRTSIAGRGAFGTVLAATWRPAGRRAPGAELRVALKALQPVAPPATCDVQAQQAYKAAQSRWEREPAAAACRAYLGLRQELSILGSLRHPHVVPLRAVCCAPLALLLALAPMGALDGMIREYRWCGGRVRPRAARALLLQVARALEYLHSKRIVYRDLKSENVLVWRMPKPPEAAAAEVAPGPVDVHVKLGDYGISRTAPPSGTKGFGGTEGFMAPEIMRYNGEEEYTEKVDCFSFGMLVYEVVTCRQPFEGHEAVKEAILEGARPALSPRDLQQPACVLETMRRCWAGAPELRPSAAALVSAVAAPEFCALSDAAAARAAAAAAAAPVRAPDEEGSGWEVWYGGGEPERVHTLLAVRAHFTTHYTMRMPPDKADPVMVTAVCRVGNKMWIGDSAGRLSVYSASSCALLWTVKVQESVGGAASDVSALLYLETIQRVALALACGRLFLVTSSRPEAEGTFFLTELGTATELCCLTAIPTGDGYDVWAGGESLCVYTVGAEGARAAEGAAGGGRLAALAATPTHVLGYCSPGSIVYQWEGSSRQQTGRLDCSKLVPCSESLQSIAIDAALPQDRCRVTALCTVQQLVFAGTAWGCVVVADGATLRPLTVFRPYEADVRAIVPLVPHEGSDDEAMLATFGSGYRPLLQRYAPLQTNNSNNQYSGTYCLLWKAQNWLPD